MESAGVDATTQPLLLFGGTFDPVHATHLRMAEAALGLLPGANLRMVPAGDPPHRAPPGADAVHRLAMLRLACASNPRLRVDDREVRRKGRSYSVLTLREVRAEQGPSAPLIWVLGSDAARGLPTWHDAAVLSGLCHLLILQRPDAGLDPSVPAALGWQALSQPRALAEQPHGGWFLHQGELSVLSATRVRAALRARAPEASRMLTPAVLAYIHQHHLYL